MESRIESNPQLKAKIESLLPMGMDLKTATMGFRNEGQCVAALNVAKNLNIPFDQLQAKMTGNPQMSLGKAIQALRPNLTDKEADTEADKVEKQAKAAIKNQADLIGKPHAEFFFAHTFAAGTLRICTTGFTRAFAKLSGARRSSV